MVQPYAINVYLTGDLIVDAGTRHAGRRILRQVRGHRVSALDLTHAHPDHQGACHAVSEALASPSGATGGHPRALRSRVMPQQRKEGGGRCSQRGGDDGNMVHRGDSGGKEG
jgi:glyoxylase-like metal-dependent hydrolase (beta-lactamase superfamily II)